MLRELLAQVTYPDEFFTELRGILPLLPKGERETARNLILNKSSLTIEGIEDILDVGVS